MFENMIRIVPRTSEGPCMTHGTKVIVGDKEISGVQKIVITAVPGDVWRAQIECLVIPPHITLPADVIVKRPESWLSRFLRWIAGEPRDITSLDSTERHWAP